jgi:hypothetical protein
MDYFLLLTFYLNLYNIPDFNILNLEAVMKHKFLFEEKEWKAKGFYTGENGKKTDVTGKTVVKHKSGKWILEAEMYVPMKGGKTLDLRNVYEVKPFKKGSVETTWTSENKINGKFTGRFFVAGNVIFSTYVDKKGDYVGHETMEYMGNGRYNGYGKLYYNDELASSWKVTLS